MLACWASAPRGAHNRNRAEKTKYLARPWRSKHKAGLRGDIKTNGRLIQDGPNFNQLYDKENHENVQPKRAGRKQKNETDGPFDPAPGEVHLGPRHDPRRLPPCFVPVRRGAGPSRSRGNAGRIGGRSHPRFSFSFDRLLAPPRRIPRSGRGARTRRHALRLHWLGSHRPVARSRSNGRFLPALPSFARSKNPRCAPLAGSGRDVERRRFLA